MSDCKCKSPCNPCNDNCPDDGEILDVELLDADECGGGCGNGCCPTKCNDNCGINIQSTNECLEVDTSECGVVKITSHCPPIVTAGTPNVTVDAQPCQQANCSTNFVVSVTDVDEKVKACSGDTTPGYLNRKLEAGSGIVIDEINCGGGNAYLRIGIRDGIIPECPEPPDLIIHNYSDLISVTQSGTYDHTVTIRDKTDGSFYDNVVMLGFYHNKDYMAQYIDGDANGPVRFIESSEAKGGWDMLTGNKALATSDGIRIKQSGHYFIYGQITVVLNRGDPNRYFNLGRALLKLKRDGSEYLIQTAKHGAYGTFVALKGGNGINVDQDGTISITRGTVNVGSDGGTYEVSFQQGSGMQPTSGFDGPWATLNVGVYLDLKVGDVLTLGYRPQSDVPDAKNKSGSFRLVGNDDVTTSYQALFGGTVIGLHPVTPTLLQKGAMRDIIQ